MNLWYLHSEHCHLCQDIRESGLKHQIRRLVSGVPRLSWTPLPHDPIWRDVRTDDNGAAYVHKVYGSVEAARVFDQMDMQPITPLLIVEKERGVETVDLIAVITGVQDPSEEEIDEALDDLDFSMQMLAEDLFEIYMDILGVSEPNREVAMHEKLVGYPSLVPEIDDEFSLVEWQRSFEDVERMVYQ